LGHIRAFERRVQDFFTGTGHGQVARFGKMRPMELPATFDVTSFALGFIVGPVAYFALGLTAYGIYRAAKWITAPLRHIKLTHQPLRP
jgi:hypothetical protein